MDECKGCVCVCVHASVSANELAGGSEGASAVGCSEAAFLGFTL